MKLEDLKKLEVASPRAAHADHEHVSAIVKVREPHYVPSGVDVRSRIDATMFTASFRADALPRLEKDPAVESVALARRLPLVD